MFTFSAIKKAIAATILLAVLYAIWIQRLPALLAASAPPPAERQYGRIEIMKLIRNIDKHSDAKLGFYLIYHFNNKTQRSPEKGLITLAKTEKQILNDSLIVTNETPWNTLTIEIRDNRKQRVGTIGFDSKLNVFYGKSHCTTYPFRLESVYPYEEFPTYSAPRSERVQCIGNGDHYVELTLRMLDG
ncbi:MAG: hypothetical protein ACK502_04055 [Alphaproteobacteria bacterium]